MLRSKTMVGGPIVRRNSDKGARVKAWYVATTLYVRRHHTMLLSVSIEYQFGYRKHQEEKNHGFFCVSSHINEYIEARVHGFRVRNAFGTSSIFDLAAHRLMFQPRKADQL